MSAVGQTGGRLVVEALAGAGVTHCFGVPGESFLGILDACYDSTIRVVSTRHEGGASFMASGFAKLSGEIAVCFGTRAVGTANLAIGVHNARQDSTPMLVIAGQVNRSFAGREAFQEVDLVAAMTPLTKWATQIPSADLAAEIMARAIEVARSGRPGPVFLSVPQDVCDELSTHGSWPPPVVARPRPDPAAVAAVLDQLLSARRPLIFAGGGVYQSPGALHLLQGLAEAIDIPVITSWRHHDEFPNDHRLYLGTAGLGAPSAVWDRIRETDVMLVLANRLQENTTDGYVYPTAGTRLLCVDIEPSALAGHRSPALTVVADAGAMLSALIEQAGAEPAGRDRRRPGNAADRQRYLDSVALPAAPAGGNGVAYIDVVRTMMDELTPETVITTDAGNFYGWFSRYYPFRRTGTYLGPASGAMGYGLPAAIGAKLARPGAQVVSVSGDGGFLMTMAELETAVRYDVGVVAIVLDNSRHGTIRMHQENQYPGRVVGTELGRTDLSLVAQGLGAAGYLVEDAADFGPALRSALRSGRTSVIQVRMDREQLSVLRRLPSEPPAS